MKRFFLTICALLAAFVFCAAAENENYGAMEISVRCNTEYEGTLEAGENEIFFAATDPRRGELILRENGRFSYTPDRNFSGKDYFGYRTKDTAGNISQEKTIIIKVIRD